MQTVNIKCYWCFYKNKNNNNSKNKKKKPTIFIKKILQSINNNNNNNNNKDNYRFHSTPYDTHINSMTSHSNYVSASCYS